MKSTFRKVFGASRGQVCEQVRYIEDLHAENQFLTLELVQLEKIVQELELKVDLITKSN